MMESYKHDFYKYRALPIMASSQGTNQIRHKIQQAFLTHKFSFATTTKEQLHKILTVGCHHARGAAICVPAALGGG
jgi:hypothetical protein